MFPINDRRCLPLLVVLVLSLAGCQSEGTGSEAATESAPKRETNSPQNNELHPPTGPGIMAATLTSGGIAGLSDLTQVTYDWKLITVRSFDGQNQGVRILNGEEQLKLGATLKKFKTLRFSSSSPAGMSDGRASNVAAVGTGVGNGSKEHAEELSKLLKEFAKANKQGK